MILNLLGIVGRTLNTKMSNQKPKEMKNNISIIISSIIFHIEEGGYDKLKEYLETIHKYFSSYEDNSEIIPDIENRIAEIFLNKLKNGIQVVTTQDVEALMATMGSIKDFKEVELDL